MIQLKTNHSRMAGRTAATVMAALSIWAIPIAVAWSAEDAPTCLSATGEAALAPCRREMLRDPDNVEIRFALSDALMGLRRYSDAVTVLREGLERLPGDDAIKKKLTLAESYLEEQQYIEKRKKNTAAAARSKKQDTQVRLSIIRCGKLKGVAAMAACNEGLSVDPVHPELLTGRGNVWLDMDRFGDAIGDFEAALAADPKHRDAAKGLRLARTKRDVKVAQCLQGEGPDGLKACDAALLRGASDEFDIQRRRAGLLLAMGRKKEAVEAYRVAARLNPADDQVKQALAASAPRSDIPTTGQDRNPVLVATGTTDPPTAKPIQHPEKKPPVTPAAPMPSPSTTGTAALEPPVDDSPVNTFDPHEMKKPAPEKAGPSTPQKVAMNHPRQFSNAPAIPGITH